MDKPTKVQADAHDVPTRPAQAPDATVDDLGTDSDAMISTVQDEAAKRAQLTVAANPESTELSPEVLEACLEGLEGDFERGIVVIDEEKSVDDYRFTLQQNKTAGSTWETIEEKLLTNNSTLLKKAAEMQGKGTLIGVYPNGELCILDRGFEPVITAFDAEENRITITTDTPNREAVMRDVAENGKFGDYWEIRQAAIEDGYTVPANLPDHKKKGIVAAVEAVTSVPFVKSENREESRRSAILDCGDVSRDTSVHAVNFYSNEGRAHVGYASPRNRLSFRGAVRVLRG